MWFLPAVGLPLLLAAALAVPGWRGPGERLLPLAPLPALAAAWAMPAGETAIGWLLLGLRVGLDEPGRWLLAAIALAWLAAALQLRASSGHRAARARFAAFFLLSMTGTLGAAMALDRPGFYSFFAIATLASYGLIVAGAGIAARRAGRLYLVLALAGELAVLAGLMAQALGAAPVTVILLLYAGFGAKLGIVPLHVALPPAYRAAPPVGAAPLAGPVLSVAALGWLRLVPFEAGGTGAPADLGLAVMALGFLAAFYGAGAGSLQRRPAALLAYSSISQMGILMATLGLALAAGGETAALLAGATVFVVHHTLAKAALFLGLGARRDRPGGVLVFPAFVFLSLSLAGLALTGGALGKLWIETAAAELPGPAAAAFAMALPATSVATGLLMARFLWLTRRAPATARGPGWPAPALAVGALALPWAMALAGHPHPVELGFGLGHVWKTLWPVLLAIALALAIGAAGRGHPGWRRLAVAPGDIGARLLRADPAAMVARLGAVPAPQLRLPALPDAGRANLRLRPLAVYGSIYLALLLSLILLAGVV